MLLYSNTIRDKNHALNLLCGLPINQTLEYKVILLWSNPQVRGVRDIACGLNPAHRALPSSSRCCHWVEVDTHCTSLPRMHATHGLHSSQSVTQAPHSAALAPLIWPTNPNEFDTPALNDYLLYNPVKMNKTKIIIPKKAGFHIILQSIHSHFVKWPEARIGSKYIFSWIIDTSSKIKSICWIIQGEKSAGVLQVRNEVNWQKLHRELEWHLPILYWLKH